MTITIEPKEIVELLALLKNEESADRIMSRIADELLQIKFQFPDVSVPVAEPHDI